MDQTAINGSNQAFVTVPAGYSTRDLTGAIGTVALTTSESASDIIELTGALAGNVTLVIATPTVPQVVGTAVVAAPTPSTPGGGYQVAPSWMKIFRNLTSGGFSVTLIGPGGTGKIAPNGLGEWFYSPDGINVKDVCCTRGG